MAKKKNRVFVIDSSELKGISPIVDEKDLLITNQEEWDQFQESETTYNELIIMPELKGEGWGDKKNEPNIFYGYTLAYKYLGSWSSDFIFNILFLHKTSRNLLLNKSGKYSIFTRKFPHFDIREGMDNFYVPSLSKRKFDYLVNYCLLKVGILNDILHDLRYPDKINDVLTSIERNHELVDEATLNIVKNLRKEKDSDRRESLRRELLSSISVLKSDLGSEREEIGGHKFDYSIMVVEDNPNHLKKIVDAFSKYFKTVKGFDSGAEALKELEKDAAYYQGLITDMELLDGEFDDLVQGIDLLEYCETEVPFITTRIITASPKDALKRLTGKTNDQIIYKDPGSDNFIPPYENLNRFANVMDDEIKFRQDKFLNMQGPKISWWGTLLTRELYLLEMNDAEAYRELWDKAISDADDFISGKLDDLAEKDKLSVQFVSISDTTHRPERGLEIIDRLLSHRLIALWFARKHGWNDFYFRGRSDIKSYANLPGFQYGMITKSPRQYFQSFLGFSVEGASTKGKEEEVSKCRVLFKDLFPIEEEWLMNILGSNLDTMILREVNPNFQEEFIEFFKIYLGEYLSDNITAAKALDVLDEFYSENLSDGTLDPSSRKELMPSLKKMAEFKKIPEELKDKVKDIQVDIF